MSVLGPSHLTIRHHQVCHLRRTQNKGDFKYLQLPDSTTEWPSASPIKSSGLRKPPPVSSTLVSLQNANPKTPCPATTPCLDGDILRWSSYHTVQEKPRWRQGCTVVCAALISQESTASITRHSLSFACTSTDVNCTKNGVTPWVNPPALSLRTVTASWVRALLQASLHSNPWAALFLSQVSGLLSVTDSFKTSHILHSWSNYSWTFSISLYLRDVLSSCL